MFAYLRYFAAVSLVLIVIGAVVVGQVFKSMSGEDLRGLTNETNQTLTQAYVNAVWKEHYPRLFADFRSDSRQFFEEMPIVRMNVYSSNGKPLYSSNGSQITITEEDRASQQALYANAINGTTATRILENAVFFLNSGEQVIGTLVQTVTPINSDQFPDILSTPNQPNANRVEGVIELYFDITPQWDRLDLLSNIASMTIVIIFIVVIAILIYISRKAELIIAKQHEVNLELTAAASSAEAENREKSQFLANISHELRTPLNAIIGFSEIIKTEQSLAHNPVHSDYIRDIHSSGVHLLSLINDILDYSKAEAGKLELELSEIDATKLIKNSMRLVIPRADEANVTLLEEMPAERIIMYTDGKKLKQVLLNLLSNAVKFTKAGGQVRVTAWHNVVDKSVCLEVADTGIGIAPKDISRVMTPFGQVDSTLARKYEGTGLGLPLSKKFVETMGGTFTIDSEVDKGTTITIKLPVNAPTDSAKHGSDKVEEADEILMEEPIEEEGSTEEGGDMMIASASETHLEQPEVLPEEPTAALEPVMEEQPALETHQAESDLTLQPAPEPFEGAPIEPAQEITEDLEQHEFTEPAESEAMPETPVYEEPAVEVPMAEVPIEQPVQEEIPDVTEEAPAPQTDDFMQAPVAAAPPPPPVEPAPEAPMETPAEVSPAQPLDLAPIQPTVPLEQPATLDYQDYQAPEEEALSITPAPESVTPEPIAPEASQEIPLEETPVDVIAEEPIPEEVSQREEEESEGNSDSGIKLTLNDGFAPNPKDDNTQF